MSITDSGIQPGTADFDQLQRALDSGERVLWSGRPPGGILFRPQDIFLIPFSLLWCGFAIFWEFMASSAPGAPAFFVLWGGMFVTIGLYFVFGRFIVDAAARARTVYAVTTERILIQSRLFRATTRSLDLASLGQVNLRETSDGRGTITFGNDNAYGPFGSIAGRGWPGMNQQAAPAFEGIADARGVNRIIRDAQKAARSGS